ncbi:hypothetical protein CHN50_14195 [Priestia aryabhattai]|uniref:DPP IV N-terminal domain-containing protein n=1 Tax=Priestia sp. GS2 TaxID=3117403 RepID=UPI000B9FD4E8|nr:hypothetical protein CHN50_14195 [Priestia aryabhattai]
MKKGFLWGAKIVVFILLISSIYLSYTQSNDPYRFFTGLGSEISISPNDARFLFSYYKDGNEQVYRSSISGKDVQQLTTSSETRSHTPRYSSDGKRILFLTKKPGVDEPNVLNVANADGQSLQKISDDSLHVTDAVFSTNSQQIYFIGMPASDLGKLEGTEEGGNNLYAADVQTGKVKQLTKKDYFVMSDLAIDDEKVYYKIPNDQDYSDELYEYDIKTKKEQAVTQLKLPGDMYETTFSPTGNQVAYTAVSQESENSSLYEYELFLFDVQSNNTEQLTTLKSSVNSPVFFHKRNKVAFLHDTAWAAQPEEYKLKTIDLKTKEIQEVELAIPKDANNEVLSSLVGYIGNVYTIALLYVVLLSLFTYSFRKDKPYLIPIISLSIAIVGVIASFVTAAVFDPWAGIGIGTLSISIAACSIILFLVAFFIKQVTTKRNHSL